jgi:hypothetical protein
LIDRLPYLLYLQLFFNYLMKRQDFIV